MTKFNPDNKESLTFEEALDPVTTIIDQDDADQYFEAYTKYIQGWLEKEPRNDTLTAEEIAKINIGYWSGYCTDEVEERIKKLFKCKHPIYDN